MSNDNQRRKRRRCPSKDTGSHFSDNNRYPSPWRSSCARTTAHRIHASTGERTPFNSYSILIQSSLKQTTSPVRNAKGKKKEGKKNSSYPLINLILRLFENLHLEKNKRVREKEREREGNKQKKQRHVERCQNNSGREREERKRERQRRGEGEARGEERERERRGTVARSIHTANPVVTHGIPYS